MDTPSTPSKAGPPVEPTTTAAKALKMARIFVSNPAPPPKPAKQRTGKSVMTWWDSAAINMASGGAASPDRLLARARNHANANVKNFNEWRDQEMAKFIGTSPKKPKLRLEWKETEPKCWSPDHFSRKYGKRAFESPRRNVALDPLPHAAVLGTIAQDALPLSARERATQAARQSCWRAAALVDVAQVGRDAAAAL